MSPNLVIAEKAHSELGASVAARWMACPGSVNLSRHVPTPPTTSFAQEGTAAHALAEISLSHDVDPLMYVGATFEGVEVTEEMAEYVSVYVDFCKTLPSRQHWVEKKFTLAALHPPGPMFGTADFVALDAAETLYVVDLKYGQGVVVEAKNNKQLRYYALGALLSLPEGSAVDRIVMTIVQPRALHPDGPIREEEISYADLMEFAGELLDAAKATTRPDAPLNPGAHCRFCPASGVCPAQRDRAQEIAQIEFGALPLDVPPEPSTLPPAVFADILGKLHILEDWATAMRAQAFAKLERGEDVPGHKLVAKRPTRRWANAEHAMQALTAEGVWNEDDLSVAPKMKSPAQVEKIIGKKNLPSELTTKVSSGYSMVPAHDPRPALSLSAGSEFFPALPSGEEQ